jgi:hypothetical protein
MRKVFITLFVGLLSIACREELTPLKAPIDPPLSTNCQELSIEKNILGTWQFETVGPTSASPIRRGRITFDNQNNIVDPDSLFDNYINTGSSMAKVMRKTYDTDGDYQPISYPGRLFRIVLDTKGFGESRPNYVDTNECRKIVIYDTRTYRLPYKTGFILTR